MSTFSEICRGLFSPSIGRSGGTGTPGAALALVGRPGPILAPQDGKARLLRAVTIHDPGSR